MSKKFYTCEEILEIIDDPKFVRFERIRRKWNRYVKVTVDYIQGLIDENGHVYQSLLFNHFDKKPIIVPADYTEIEVDPEWVKHRFNPEKKHLDENNKYYQDILKEHSDCELSFTFYNGSNPFLIYTSIDNHVTIYKKSNNVYYSNYEHKQWKYIKKVTEFKALQIWKPDGYDSDGHHAPEPNFDGNSMLYLTEDNKYIHVGVEIYQFELLEGDTVKNYFSPVGYSHCSHPMIIGTKNIYFLDRKMYVNLEDIPNDFYLYRDDFTQRTEQERAIECWNQFICYQDNNEYLLLKELYIEIINKWNNC